MIDHIYLPVIDLKRSDTFYGGMSRGKRRVADVPLYQLARPREGRAAGVPGRAPIDAPLLVTDASLGDAE